MRKKRTKNRHIRSRNKHRKNKKRSHVKSKNKKRKNTKRKNPIREKRAGMMDRLKRCVGCVTGAPPTPMPAELEPEPEPELESDDHMPVGGESPTGLVDKFFTVERGDEGDKYKLKGDLQVISAHGSIRTAYTVVPEGITLYFLVGAGFNLVSYMETGLRNRNSRATNGQLTQDDYLRMYGPGSLIQEHRLNFRPYAVKDSELVNTIEGGVLEYWPSGLLKFKLKQGGRDYTSGFTCRVTGLCHTIAMMHLRSCIMENIRRMKRDRAISANLWARHLWSDISNKNKQELISFAEDNGITPMEPPAAYVHICGIYGIDPVFEFSDKIKALNTIRGNLGMDPISIDSEATDFDEGVIETLPQLGITFKKMTAHKIKKIIIMQEGKILRSITREDILEYIQKNLDKFHDGNIDGIITKEELQDFNGEDEIWTKFTLSELLNRIAVAMESDHTISGDWFGNFCREGEALDITTLQECNGKFFEPLPPDFFSDDIHFEGVTDELRRQNSLASKSETANFKGTVDALQEYCQGGEIPQLDSTAQQEVKDTLNDIHTRLSNGEPISLTPDEVCFIFQLKYHLQKQGISF